MGVVHVNDSECKFIEFKDNSMPVMLENGNQIFTTQEHVIPSTKQTEKICDGGVQSLCKTTTCMLMVHISCLGTCPQIDVERFHSVRDVKIDKQRLHLGNCYIGLPVTHSYPTSIGCKLYELCSYTVEQGRSCSLQSLRLFNLSVLRLFGLSGLGICKDTLRLKSAVNMSRLQIL
ncbi:hypothetical protein VNO80_03619 [Phaseolus coccineus]|uniref:Uncharacterized protein n=1 Tax=Phaseolus coccineus TaxID=3886 RepID=A0AAN9RNR4_PHACN